MKELKDIIEMIETKKKNLLNSKISKKLKQEYLNKYDTLLLEYYVKYINSKEKK